MYDDAKVQAVQGGVGEQKPTQVHVMVYVNPRGGASWEGLVL